MSLPCRLLPRACQQAARDVRRGAGGRALGEGPLCSVPYGRSHGACSFSVTVEGLGGLASGVTVSHRTASCARPLGNSYPDLARPQRQRLSSALSPQTTRVALAASTACRPTAWTRVRWASTTRARRRSMSPRKVRPRHAGRVLPSPRTRSCPGALAGEPAAPVLPQPA